MRNRIVAMYAALLAPRSALFFLVSISACQFAVGAGVPAGPVGGARGAGPTARGGAVGSAGSVARAGIMIGGPVRTDATTGYGFGLGTYGAPFSPSLSPGFYPGYQPPFGQTPGQYPGLPLGQYPGLYPGLYPGQTIGPSPLGSANYQPGLFPGSSVPYGAQVPITSPYGVSPVASICSSVSNQFFALADQIRSQMFEPTRRLARQSQGHYHPDLDRRQSEIVGRGMSQNLNHQGSKDCGMFINKKGKTRAWGDLALQDIKEHDECYGGEKAPRDIGRYCANYQNMDAHRRRLFWVWLFASMADAESSCQEDAKNGGLFQLTTDKCHAAGVEGFSDADLHDAGQSIKCSVAGLCRELQCRGKLAAQPAAAYHDPSCRTYWGTLRPGTAGSEGDEAGSKKVLALANAYSDCELGSTGPSEDNHSPRVELRTPATAPPSDEEKEAPKKRAAEPAPQIDDSK